MIANFPALKNIWKIPDLRRKLLFTLMILAIFRIGSHVPIPFLDRVQLVEFIESLRSGIGGGLFNVIDLFSGRAFSQMSVFALGIMPYISVSILLQLLTIVLPRLQKLQQEGQLGQRKINKWTRQGTVVLAAFQGLGLSWVLVGSTPPITYMTGGYQYLFILSTVVTLTTGTAFLMWLGERITDKGIGNGISLIIATGILCEYPSSLFTLGSQIVNETLAPIWIPIVAAFFIISTVTIILIQEGTRRIPMQHAKGRVVGRRVMAGGTSYLPLKVNTAGVIPVIFASAILSFPGFIASFVSGGDPGGGTIGSLFSQQSPWNLYNFFQNTFGLQQEGAFLIFKSVNMYIGMFTLLTGFFCFFYTAVAFNPDDIANNLKKSGSFIPGKRPGKPTSEYIDYVLTRITTVGAIFLCIIAILPMVMETSFMMPFAAHNFVGGTGLIIVVGVVLDTVRQIESQLMMRNYEGLTTARRAAPARQR